MKTFIADFGKFVRDTQWDFVIYIMASIFWLIWMPFHVPPVRDTALWLMLLAIYVRPYKSKVQYDTELANYQRIMRMFGAVLAELHYIQDELNKEVVVPDKSFWTADTVEQFNNHKP